MNADLGNFLNWLSRHKQRGFIGEIGWPSGPDADQWNAVGESVYSKCNEAGVGITYWAAGEWLSSDGGLYNQDAYAAISRKPQSQTEVIEKPENLSPRLSSERSVE